MLLMKDRLSSVLHYSSVHCRSSLLIFWHGSFPYFFHVLNIVPFPPMSNFAIISSFLSALLPLSCFLLICISLSHNLLFYSLSPDPLCYLLLELHHACTNSCLLEWISSILVRKGSWGQQDCLSGHHINSGSSFPVEFKQLLSFDI